MADPLTVAEFVKAAPSSWFPNGPGSVHFRVFRTMNLEKEEISEGQRILDLGGTRAILYRGPVKYHAATVDTNQEETAEAQGPLFSIRVETRVLKDWIYLIVMAPQTSSENSTEAIEAAEGLLLAFFGRSILYERIFDQTIQIEAGTWSLTSPLILNPGFLPKPRVDSDALDIVAAASARLNALPESERNRIRLSLRWFSHSMLSAGGVDGFVQLWIALETLGMPDTTNIGPLNELLAAAYGINLAEAGARFGIGRIFGLRGDIMHRGRRMGIHGQLTHFLSAVFLDILCQVLGMPNQQKAQQALDDVRFPRAEWFPGG